MLTTYQFKGKDLFPFSAGRRDVAVSLGLRCFTGAKPTLMDMHTLLLICLSPPARLAKAVRDPDAFIEDVLAWVDANITEADYEEEAKLVAEIVTNALKTRAVPQRSELPEVMTDDPNS